MRATLLRMFVASSLLVAAVGVAVGSAPAQAAQNPCPIQANTPPGANLCWQLGFNPQYNDIEAYEHGEFGGQLQYLGEAVWYEGSVVASTGCNYCSAATLSGVPLVNGDTNGNDYAVENIVEQNGVCDYWMTFLAAYTTTGPYRC